MNEKQKLQQKLQEWWDSGDEQFDVLTEIFESYYQAGLDAQRESDAIIALSAFKDDVYDSIKNNTGDL